VSKAKKGKWTSLVMAGFVAAFVGLVVLAEALAEEPPPPPTPPAPAGGAAPAPAPAGAPEAAPAKPATPTTTTAAKAAEEPPPAPRQSVLDTIAKGRVIGFIIIGLSMVSLALVIEHAVTIRRDKLCPPELASELEDYFNQEQYEEALELCNVEHNLLTDVIRAGLSRIDSGYERMQEAMQEAGEEAAVSLQQKISYLSLIGNISPMLGLLGTVRGMVGAFGQIAAMKVVRPQVLAGNINEALVTTLLGLIVAIPTMCFYQFFSNRVNKLVLESSTIVSDLMERFKPTK